MTLPAIPMRAFCAWRARRAALTGAGGGGEGPGSVERTVRKAGWLLAPGSTAPYLSLRVRNAGCTRAVVDRAVLENRELIRVTSVRGQPHFVPRRQVMLAIAAKGRRIDARIRQIGKVVSISRGEVETLAMAITEFLRDGPATVAELEEGLPAGMLRSFGTEGRRAGVAGILPVALELLEEEGRVLYLDAGRRIDDGCHAYTLVEHVLPEAEGPAPDQLDVLPEVLHTYLRSFGPARLEDFVWWAGTTLNRARTAAAALEVAPVDVEIEGLEGKYSTLPDDLESLEHFTPSETPEVALIPNRDPFYLGRKVLTREFLDVDAPEMVLTRFRGKPVAARVLPVVLVDGRIAGIWEWGAEEEKVRWALLDAGQAGGKPPKSVVDAIEKEADRVRGIIREELGGHVVLDPVERGAHWTYGVEEIRAFW